MSDHVEVRGLAISQTRSTTTVGLSWCEAWRYLSIGKEVSRLLTRKGKRQKSIAIPDLPGCVRLVTAQSGGASGSAKCAESQQVSSEHKLHIVMDKESFMKLRWLKAQLEASTDAEVVRRALKAYEIFEPDDESKDGPSGPNAEPLATASVEHLYIRIPQRMKDQLDLEQKASGSSYGQQVRQALRVLTQLVRDVETWKRNLAGSPGTQKGEADDNLSLKLAAVC
jgi:hypothetical protein